MLNEIISNAIDASFSSTKFKLSGNADARTIKEVYSQHDIEIEQAMINSVGGTLSTVKRSRNNLAHGSSSFADSAKDTTIQDIEGYTKSIIDFLDYLNKISNQFVNRHGYLC